MGTYLDYIDWRGDLNMDVSPFNEIDNLILAELAYVKMENIVPGIDSAETVPLHYICKEYERLGYKAQGNSNDAYPLLKKVSQCKRFSDIKVGAYTDTVDVEKAIQFSAVSFYMPDGTTYIAFRGTDNTIVGWREDFTLSYLSETPGQYEAVRYLERIAARTEGPLLVGGHSKGGNLAVYASAFCRETVGNRILVVYSNDGPGFNRSITETWEYQDILKKVRLYIPESSMIGILLINKEEKTIVMSSANGMQQHDPYTWQVLGTRFVETESQSQVSQLVDETIKRWLLNLNDAQKENLVKVIFDSMEATGAQTITELNLNRWNSYSTIMKAVLDMDPAIQKDVWKTAQKLAAAGREVLFEDAKESIEESLTQWAEQHKTRE